MYRKLENINTYLRYFLLVLFLSYAAGITLFTHSHVINGVTIVHSHPYNKDLAHSHSSVELDLIHLLNHFYAISHFFIDIALAFLPLFFISLSFKYIASRSDTPFYGLVGLRAPPFTLFC